MTYTPDTEFSLPSAEPSTVEKLRTLQQEGSQRSKRIFKILSTAFTETAAEFKDGRAVISPLAKDVTTETVATVKEKSQQAADVLNQTWSQEAEHEELTDRIISFVRTLGKTAQEKLSPQLKDQASKLDVILSDRYGHRYENVKARLDDIRAWYVASGAAAPEAEADKPTEHVISIEVDSEIVG
ncbi:MAG: hypothetical protein WBD47_18615 [Phormidesmis sp.]